MTACAFPSYVYLNYLHSYVMLKMHSKNDEEDVLKVLESKIFFCGKTFTEFFKKFLFGFYNSVVTCVTKVGCPFWTCQMLSLNSKIGTLNLCAHTQKKFENW